MRVAARWLREWLVLSADNRTLAKTLTMLGLEAEIVAAAAEIEKVVVGEILNVRKLSGKTGYLVCELKCSLRKKITMITTADVHPGLKIAVALVGARLPKLEVREKMIEGILSEAIICSSAMLGLGDSDTILVLDDDAPVGENLHTYLNLDDEIFAFDLTPNRGDCFSVLGLARDLSAHYETNFSLPEIIEKKTANEKISVEISTPKLCPKYLCRIVKNIDNSVKTPDWMAERLRKAGQKTHSPVVDVTNYVLLELGQPMHAFDRAKISEKIIVRKAAAGETMTLLDGQSIILDDELVVADGKKPQALAGVIGASASGVQAQTTKIILESAFFEPGAVSTAAKRHNLHTESMLRFERGVDFELQKFALERATDLILSICGGVAGEISEYRKTKFLPVLPTIEIDLKMIEKALGFAPQKSWVAAKFEKLGFEILRFENQKWTVKPPSFRFDIRIAADLVEELARLYGYDKLPVAALEFSVDMRPQAETIAPPGFVKMLSAKSYREVINYSFIAPAVHDLTSAPSSPVRVENPLSEDLSVMRQSLWGGLLKTLAHNHRRGEENLRLVEVGLCFEGLSADLQKQKIAACANGERYLFPWSEKSEPLDFFDIKGDLESLLKLCGRDYHFVAAHHPALQDGQSAQVFVEDEAIGWVGALSPKIQQYFDLPKTYVFEILLAPIQTPPRVHYQKLSPYQRSMRDIAVVVDIEIAAGELVAAIKSLGRTTLRDVRIFDIYTGTGVAAGKKSVALNLIFQSDKKTLTDEALDAEVVHILKILAEKFSAEQR